jgi:U3 small nucleolar RNA-associated protein 15
VIIKEFGAIDHIDFCGVEPYNFAATCSVRVQIYNPVTKLVLKNISTFQKQAYGATFRKDGQLLVAGDEEANVRLFDTNTKTVLRLFKGHKAPVHRTYFTTDSHHVASFSDDKSVIVWDIATEKSIASFRFHTDYVRAGAINPVSENTILSGSYDNTIKMYDIRSNKCVMTLTHGSPLESLVFLPTGGIFISAGGNDIKVWDIVSGGRQLTNISQHTKTVTSLAVTSDGRHLISGSLDRKVKFFNTTNYQMINNIDYTNSILSLGISRDNSTLAVGQVDGTLAIHRREQKNEEMKVEKLRAKRRKQRNFKGADEVVERFRMERQEKYDNLLRKFEYSAALDCVLTRGYVNRTPQVTVAVMQELMRRQGLVTAFSNRTQDSLAKIITFFNKYISDGRFTRVLIDIANIFMDIYEKSFLSLSTDVQRLVIELCRRIKVEEELTLEFLKLEGSLDMIINAAAGAKESQIVETSKLHPSLNAQQAAVINL